MESWIFLKLAFDCVDQDNALGDGRKTRKEEPGTLNDYVKQSRLQAQPRLFHRQKYSLVTILLDLFVIAESFLLLIHIGCCISQRKEFCSQISLGNHEFNKNIQTFFLKEFSAPLIY